MKKVKDSRKHKKINDSRERKKIDPETVACGLGAEIVQSAPSGVVRVDKDADWALDGATVSGVTRIERMSDNHIWVCVYMKSGERVVVNLTSRGKIKMELEE